MHRSVLLHESIESLNLGPGKVVLDGTVGGGGHTLEIAKRFGQHLTIIALDADERAVERTKERLQGIESDVKFFRANFRDIDAVLEQAGVERLDAILLDLGWSSDQIEISGRGFSFQHDEPLLMTYDVTPDERDTARYFLNHATEKELAEVIAQFGEEGQARNIARAIVSVRQQKPIQTTLDLVAAIREGYKGRYPRSIHFATKTFQALRIKINDEFGALRAALQCGFRKLNPGGRFAVISFHSSEDRIVKTFFKQQIEQQHATAITKKPIVPSTEELIENRRARSSKLRVIQKN